MLVVFIAVSTAVAAVSKRSPLQRGLIVLSSIPIALVCNVIRITGTGVLHETAGHEVADFFYHDLLGVFMIPMALVLLWIELQLLNRLFVADVDSSRSASQRRLMKQLLVGSAAAGGGPGSASGALNPSLKHH
jgi:exosortase/archaeosortase family protein